MDGNKVVNLPLSARAKELEAMEQLLRGAHAIVALCELASQRDVAPEYGVVQDSVADALSLAGSLLEESRASLVDLQNEADGALSRAA